MKQQGQQEQGYVMHAGMQMGVVSLFVADLERSLRFYKQVLGCTILARSNSSVVLGGEYPLLLLTERREASLRPENSAGLYHVALLLPSRVDLACALHHLLSLGYPIREMTDHLISEAIYLADSEGNGIELYRDRPRSAWPWQNGRLEASGPSINLSAENLLAELEETGSEWQGLPAFTRVGHVHLEVTDLAQSAAFYRGVLGLAESITGIDGAAFFAAGGYHHHIGCNVWSSRTATPTANSLGLHFFTLSLPEQAEVMQLAARAQVAGIPVKQYGQSYLLCDPSGNQLLLTPLRKASEVISLATEMK